MPRRRPAVCDWCGRWPPVYDEPCPRCGNKRAMLHVCEECRHHATNPIGAYCNECNDEPWEE